MKMYKGTRRQTEMRKNTMAFLSAGVTAMFSVVTAIVEFMAGSPAYGCVALATTLLTAMLLLLKLRLRSNTKVTSTLA